jgi:hypothetical protein
MLRSLPPFLAGAALLALAGCAQPPAPKPVAAAPALDGFIAFADPSVCQEAPDYRRFLDSLHRLDTTGTKLLLGKPAIPPAYAASFGAPTIRRGSEGEQIVQVPVNGTWRGLRVKEIVRVAKAQTDWINEGVVFAAPKAAVLKAANDAGFALPPSGERTLPEGLEMQIAVSALRGDPPSAMLSCGT